MVVYGRCKIPQSMMGVAKTAIRFSFSGPVPQFFRNFQKTFIADYRSFKISYTGVVVAKMPILEPFCGLDT